MKKGLKIFTGVVVCCTVLTLAITFKYNYDNKKIANNEPIVFTTVSHFDTLYDFSNPKILAEHSDMVVIGKVTEINDATNFNPTTKKYGRARTPGKLEVINVLKNNKSEDVKTISFMDYGGTLPYVEYAKGLLPAQREKREYLMQKNGKIKLSENKNNIFIQQKAEKQLELGKDKTYIMYLRYDEDFDKYVVVSQPYGVKEYNTNTGKILNHVTNEVEEISNMM